MSLTIKGKALLVITRLHDDGQDPDYEVTSFIQRAGGLYEDEDELRLAFDGLRNEEHPLPARAYRLSPGETLRVAVTVKYTMVWYETYEGDYDFRADLEYLKQKILRVQRYRPRYEKKL